MHASLVQLKGGEGMFGIYATYQMKMDSAVGGGARGLIVIKEADMYLIPSQDWPSYSYKNKNINASFCLNLNGKVIR